MYKWRTSKFSCSLKVFTKCLTHGGLTAKVMVGKYLTDNGQFFLASTSNKEERINLLTALSKGHHNSVRAMTVSVGIF